MPEPNEARQEAAARAALRHTARDQRARIGRRVRGLENQLRTALRKQGQTISIDADITIGQVAQAQVRIEAFRAQMSRGLEINDEQFSRLINILQRGLAKLGLRPTLFDDGRAPRGLRVAREHWNTQAAQNDPAK
jgi:hypothetical protein